MSIFVYVVCADAAEAEKIGRALVEARLAACANIVPGMNSIYRWQGRVEAAQETILILKSREALFEKICGQVRALHSYETPCITAWPLTHGDRDFLDWIAANTLAE